MAAIPFKPFASLGDACHRWEPAMPTRQRLARRQPGIGQVALEPAPGTLGELNVDSYRRRTAMANKRSRGRPATGATLKTSHSVSPSDNGSTDLPGSPGEAG